MFNIGDRVLFKRGKIGSTVELLRDYIKEGIIVEVGYKNSHRYKIRTRDKTVSGDFVETWVSGSELEIDISYYRNLKIKSIIDV
jgi:hypothetical protein